MLNFQEYLTFMVLTLVNGEQTDKISIFDRGLHYGDGIFETIRVHQNKPIFWEDHLERLTSSANHLSIPVSKAFIHQIENEINFLLTKQPVDVGMLKIIITRGGESAGYRLQNSSQPNRILIYKSYAPNVLHESNGIMINYAKKPLYRDTDLAGIKHLNRLPQVLASLEFAQQTPYQELLLCDENDHVIEGTCSNLFVFYQNKLLTPDLSKSGIRGILRKKMLEWAAIIGLETQETTLPKSALHTADGMFVCNSLWGIWPVIKLEKDYPILPEIRDLQSILTTHYD